MFPVKYINVRFPDNSTKQMHPKKAFELWSFYNLDYLYRMWDIVVEYNLHEEIDFSKFSWWVFTHSDKYIDATV